MAPANAPETMRKALAMGAARGVHVTDPALAGSDVVSTARSSRRRSAARVRPRPRRRRHLRRRVRASCRPASRRCAAAVPVVRGEDRARPGRRHRSRPPDQPDRLRRARGPDARPDLVHAGARRATLPVAQGDHGRPLASRSSTRSLADLGVDGRRPSAAAVTTTRSSTAAAAGPRRHAGRPRGTRRGRRARSWRSSPSGRII